MATNIGVPRNTEINIMFPPLPLIAAKGDNTIEDGITIQNIINFAQRNAYSSLYIPYTLTGYKISSTLTIDISKLKVEGDGAALNFHNTGIAINIISTSASGGYSNILRPIKGLYLLGFNKTSNTSIGIQIGDTIGDYASFCTFENCYITGFYACVKWSNNTWLTHFENCNFTQCTYCLYFPNGLINAGEEITFDHCTLFNCTNGIYNAGCEMVLNDCSLDYCSTRFIDCELGGSTVLNNCHIEGENDLDFWLYAGSNSSIIMLGGSINIASTKNNYQVGNGYNCVQLLLRDVYYSISGKYNFQSLLTGWGQSINLTPYVVPNQVAAIQGSSVNYGYLVNPTFTQTNYAEWLSTGTVVPSISTTVGHIDTNSLKFESISGGYTSIQKDILITPGQKPRFSCFMKFNFNGSNDIFTLTAYYIDNLGNKEGSTPFTITINNTVSNPNLWKIFRSNPTAPALGGIVKVRFIIQQASATILSDGLATMWMDDILITVD